MDPITLGVAAAVGYFVLRKKSAAPSAPATGPMEQSASQPYELHWSPDDPRLRVPQNVNTPPLYAPDLKAPGASPLFQTPVYMKSAAKLAAYGDEGADAIGAEINARVADMVAINNDLYASAEGNAALTKRVDNWHQSALAWMKAAPLAAQSEPKLAEWSLIGAKIAQNALDYANEIADSTIGAKAEAFIRNIPASAEVVGSWLRRSSVSTVQAAGDVVNAGLKEAGKGLKGVGLDLGITAVVVVGALALGAYMLTRAGAKVRAGAVSVG